MKLLLITCWKRPFTAFGERMNYNWVIALIHSDPLRQSLPYPAWSKFKRTKEDRAVSYTLVIAEGLGKCFCTGAMGSASRQAFHLRKTLSFSYTWTKNTLTLLWSKQLALILSHWHRVQMKIDRVHSLILNEKVCTTVREALTYKKDVGLLVRVFSLKRSTATAFAVLFTVLSQKKIWQEFALF